MVTLHFTKVCLEKEVLAAERWHYTSPKCVWRRKGPNRTELNVAKTVCPHSHMFSSSQRLQCSCRPHLSLAELNPASDSSQQKMPPKSRDFLAAQKTKVKRCEISMRKSPAHAQLWKGNLVITNKLFFVQNVKIVFEPITASCGDVIKTTLLGSKNCDILAIANTSPDSCLLQQTTHDEQPNQWSWSWETWWLSHVCQDSAVWEKMMSQMTIVACPRQNSNKN